MYNKSNSHYWITQNQTNEKMKTLNNPILMHIHFQQHYIHKEYIIKTPRRKSIQYAKLQTLLKFH
jgi:hypothetical protein